MPIQHAQRRFVYADNGEGFGILHIRNGIADIEIFQANHRADIPRHHFFRFFLAHAHERIQLPRFGTLDDPIGLHQSDRLAFLDGSAGYLARTAILPRKEE